MSQETPSVMMPQSFELMKRKIFDLEERLATTRMKKGEFGKDGDPWDDPVLYELEREEKTLMRSISEARDALNGTEVMRTPEQTDSVSLGHKVKVKLPDDEYAPREGIFVTLVTQNDAILLADKYGFDRDENIVLSTATPLGGAILGARRGEAVKYEAGGETLRAKIVSIEVSPLFQES